MFSTSTTPTTPRRSTVSRRAILATVGGALWTLSSVAWVISDLEQQEFDSLRFVAVAVSWWMCMVLAPRAAGLRARSGGPWAAASGRSAPRV